MDGDSGIVDETFYRCFLRIDETPNGIDGRFVLVCSNLSERRISRSNAIARSRDQWIHVILLYVRNVVVALVSYAKQSCQRQSVSMGDSCRTFVAVPILAKTGILVGSREQHLLRSLCYCTKFFHCPSGFAVQT